VWVEETGLGGDRLDNAWMAMPDRGHVVVATEIAAPRVIPDEHPFATHEMNGISIEEFVAGSEDPPPPLE
jgi:hypothetical protein